MTRNAITALKIRLLFYAVHRPQGRDEIFLVLLMIVSCVPYIFGLGFYSDDWDFLSTLSLCSDQSLFGLAQCLANNEPETIIRPPQILEFVSLFKLFGLWSTGYHLVNSTVLTAAVLLMYLALREAGFLRLLALSAALLFGLSPQYFTDRVWVAAAQANTSAAFCFAAFYLAAKVAAARPSRHGVWITASMASMVTSIAAYEVTAPVFALIPFMLLRWAQRERKAIFERLSFRRAILIFLPWVVILGIAVYTKLLLHKNLGATPAAPTAIVPVVTKLILQQDITFRDHVLHRLGPVLIRASSILLRFVYGSFGFGLPISAWRLGHNVTPSLALAAIGVFLIIQIYLWPQTSPEGPAGQNPTQWLSAASVGLLLSGLSLLPFLANPAAFGSTGMENRVTIAAAAGAAIALTGLIGSLLLVIPSARWRGSALCLIVGALCGSAFYVTGAIGGYWVVAADQQRQILSRIHTQFPYLATHTTLLLDGICPYEGPAIVFDGNADVTDALRLLYGDPSIRGDVVSSTLNIHDDRLTIGFDDWQSSYYYGNRLLVLNVGPGKIRSCDVRDKASALQCLGLSSRTQGGCPPLPERWGAGSPVL